MDPFQGKNPQPLSQDKEHMTYMNKSTLRLLTHYENGQVRNLQKDKADKSIKDPRTLEDNFFFFMDP